MPGLLYSTEAAGIASDGPGAVSGTGWSLSWVQNKCTSGSTLVLSVCLELYGAVSSRCVPETHMSAPKGLHQLHRGAS